MQGHHSLKANIRQKSFDAAQFEIGLVEFMCAQGENSLAFWSILVCSACKGALTSLNNYLPQYLVMHHLEVKSAQHLSQ